MMLATIGNDEFLERFSGLHSKGPKTFEYKLIPSYRISKLHITEKGKIVGNIVFITKNEMCNRFNY